jgi:outer membrane protein
VIAWSGTKHVLQLLRQAAGMFALLVLCIPAHGEDLLQVYHQAQANDPTFEAAQYSLAAAAEKYPQARAGNLPTVTLTANDNFTDATSAFNGGAPVNRGISAWTWTLQLTQPLMRPQNVAASNESEALVAAAQADFSQAQQDLILRVAQAYFDVLVAQETVATAEAQLSAMQEQQAVAQRGFELGTASITDSDEARAKAELARSQLVAAQNDLEDKRSEIEKLTGRLPEELAGLKPAVVEPRPEPADVNAWIGQARENSPQVRSRRAEMQAAEWGITKARAENIWTVDLVASTGTNYSSGSASMPVGYESRIKSNMAGLQFSMPIFEGGLNSSHIREAFANRDKSRAQLEEARRKAGADAKQAFAGIVNGLAQTEALQSAVDAGENSVKGNQAGYKLGIRINSDVLNAQQQLFTSKRDLAKARYETLLEGLKLKAAAGVLSESDVATINALLQR